MKFKKVEGVVKNEKEGDLIVASFQTFTIKSISQADPVYVPYGWVKQIVLESSRGRSYNGAIKQDGSFWAIISKG